MFGPYMGTTFGQWWGDNGSGPTPPAGGFIDWLLQARRRGVR